MYGNIRVDALIQKEILCLNGYILRNGVCMEECNICPYWGVVDVDENDNLVWSCTRRNCINIIDTTGWMPIENNEIKV